MRIQSLHSGFIMPTKGSDHSGAFDIYMPTSGWIDEKPILYGLGFATEIPPGHVALILPRSSTGAKHGVELNNTCGVIDSDYRGEWKAMLKIKPGNSEHGFSWSAGERLLQFLLVPVLNVSLELVDSVSQTERGTGGFGSTGQ